MTTTSRPDLRQSLAWLPTNHPQHRFPLPFYSTEPNFWRPNSGQSDSGRSLSKQPPHLLNKTNHQANKQCSVFWVFESRKPYSCLCSSGCKKHKVNKFQAASTNPMNNKHQKTKLPTCYYRPREKVMWSMITLLAFAPALATWLWASVTQLTTEAQLRKQFHTPNLTLQLQDPLQSITLPLSTKVRHGTRWLS